MRHETGRVNLILHTDTWDECDVKVSVMSGVVRVSITPSVGSYHKYGGHLTYRLEDDRLVEQSERGLLERHLLLKHRRIPGDVKARFKAALVHELEAQVRPGGAIHDAVRRIAQHEANALDTMIHHTLDSVQLLRERRRALEPFLDQEATHTRNGDN